MSVLAALREKGASSSFIRGLAYGSELPRPSPARARAGTKMEFTRGGWWWWFHSEAPVMAVVSANFHRTHLGPAFLSHPMKRLTMEATRDAHEAGPADVALPCQRPVRKGPRASPAFPSASWQVPVPAHHCLFEVPVPSP